jgi:shikimate dehydrogenase
MNQYGLIGYPLSHSFSKGYFTEKCSKENIADSSYENYPLTSIDEFRKLIETQGYTLRGLNVTIPYKQQIIPFLDELSTDAQQIGAINTIKFKTENNNIKLIGYNTDVYGFEYSLKEHLQTSHNQALILGTGGASLAVKYVLEKLGIAYRFVSRTPSIGQLSYEDIDSQTIKNHTLIINTTPLGMYPKIDQCPPLPYEALTPEHYLYDLVYNPEETLFLQKGKAQGCKIKNGLQMLHLQAEKAWQIWNDL